MRGEKKKERRGEEGWSVGRGGVQLGLELLMFLFFFPR